MRKNGRWSKKRREAQQCAALDNFRGERALLLGILERAILDLSKAPKYSLNSYQWIFNSWSPSEDYFTPFSFPWICEQLDRDPEHLQKYAYKCFVIGGPKPGRMSPARFLIKLDNCNESDEYEVNE